MVSIFFRGIPISSLSRDRPKKSSIPESFSGFVSPKGTISAIAPPHTEDNLTVAGYGGTGYTLNLSHYLSEGLYDDLLVSERGPQR